MEKIATRLKAALSFQDKRWFLYLTVILIAAISLIILTCYLNRVKIMGPEEIVPLLPERIREAMRKRNEQLETLERLREQMGSSTKSPEEQIEQLETLRKNTPPPSPQQAQEQLDELDRLRQSQ